MSLQTDSFGNQGHYLNRSTNQPCATDPNTGKYNHDQCYFDIDIRSHATGGFGVPIHTLQQESGVGSKVMPGVQRPMWVHHDLQNKCDTTTDINTCFDNTNCQINPKLSNIPPRDHFAILGDDSQNDVKGYLLDGMINNQDPYWSDKNWSKKNFDDAVYSDVCDWDGIKCDTLPDSKRYITEINHSGDYFSLPEKSSICQYNSSTLTKSDIDQNEWVHNQRQQCSDLQIDKACSDNQFCDWKDEAKQCWIVEDGKETQTHEVNAFNKEECENTKPSPNQKYVWKVGEKQLDKSKYAFYSHSYESDTVNNGHCSLKDEYKIFSGLRKDDEFKDRTLSEVLGDVNNGRVSDINIVDDVKTDRRGDVIMRSDNQETAIKGIVEETALSRYFFSPENIDAIQKTIRFRVYGKTDHVIDYQSPQELYIVMRSVLLQHGNFKVSANNLLTEILDLNKHVTTYCVNEVSSNVKQYKGYLKDLESLPVPLDRPSFNDSGSRNKSYDISNHIAITSETGWGTRHKQT